MQTGRRFCPFFWGGWLQAEGRFILCCFQLLLFPRLNISLALKRRSHLGNRLIQSVVRWRSNCELEKPAEPLLKDRGVFFLKFSFWSRPCFYALFMHFSKPFSVITVQRTSFVFYCSSVFPTTTNTAFNQCTCLQHRPDFILKVSGPFGARLLVFMIFLQTAVGTRETKLSKYIEDMKHPWKMLSWPPCTHPPLLQDRRTVVFQVKGAQDEAVGVAEPPRWLQAFRNLRLALS